MGVGYHRINYTQFFETTQVYTYCHDYFTKWAEAIPLTHVNEKVVIQFIEQQLITRFGVPSVLVFDNATYFSSTLLTEFSLDKGIIIRYSANYYP
jgi:hypothetical protein